MHRIEYKIGLNEEGRPYIDLPDDYEQRPEDRFFVIEIVRYMHQDLLNRRSGDLDENTITSIDKSERLLGQIADEMADILYGQMRAVADFEFDYHPYHVIVNNLEERDDLPETNIIFEEKIYDRREGLIVQFTDYDEEFFTPRLNRYKLVDGITNEHWVKIETKTE